MKCFTAHDNSGRVKALLIYSLINYTDLINSAAAGVLRLQTIDFTLYLIFQWQGQSNLDKQRQTNLLKSLAFLTFPIRLYV